MYLPLWVFLAQMLGYLSAACPSQLGAPLINYLTELETCGAQTLLCVQEFWNVKQKPIYESVFDYFFFACFFFLKKIATQPGNLVTDDSKVTQSDQISLRVLDERRPPQRHISTWPILWQTEVGKKN